MSELYKLAEKFLIVNSSKLNDDYRFEGFISLSRVYDDRFLDNSFKKLVSSLKEDLDNELIGFDRYHRYAMIEESIYYFNANRSNDKGLKDAVYNEMIYTICEFYRKFSRNLWKIDISIGNTNSQYEKDFAVLLNENINYDGIIKGLKGIKKQDYENLMLNNLMIKMVSEPENTKAFFEIKKLLFEIIDNYTNYERFSILSKVLSYCATAFRMGKKEFVKESVEMKSFMMKKVRFKEDGLGPLNFFVFIQTVREFLHLEDVKGAQKFTKNYIHLVEDEKIEIARNLALAYIDEEKGNYETAIEHLAILKPPDQPTKVTVRYIYLRLYYSMEHFESGFSLISAFKKFIKESNELDSYTKENHFNTLRVFEKLYKMKCNPEKYSMFDVDKVTEMIEKKYILGAPWLLQKAGELKTLIK